MARTKSQPFRALRRDTQFPNRANLSPRVNVLHGNGHIYVANKPDAANHDQITRDLAAPFASAEFAQGLAAGTAKYVRMDYNTTYRGSYLTGTYPLDDMLRILKDLGRSDVQDVILVLCLPRRGGSGAFVDSNGNRVPYAKTTNAIIRCGVFVEAQWICTASARQLLTETIVLTYRLVHDKNIRPETARYLIDDNALVGMRNVA